MDTVTDMFTRNAYAPASNSDLKNHFRNYRHQLVQFVVRYLGNHEDAEDVVQSVFVHALAGDDTSNAPPIPARSLFGAALALARDRMDARALEQGARPGDHVGGQPRRLQQDPFELIVREQLKARLEASLRAFPQSILDTFDLVVNGETSHVDAAEYLGVPLSTVQTHMACVVELMRDCTVEM
ncbi:hypothetical protein CSQ96_15025 [Janthinobacterium sp. BJB412]|nr:hypothetical protein CSQ96_15025 [Janthinobacterium sp. BJB412]